MLSAAAVSASPLRVNDRDYRGAFTIPGAGRIQGQTARYWTDIKIFNDSDHQIYLRFELYSTAGYREALIDVNPIAAGGAAGYTWGSGYTNGLDPVTGLPITPDPPDFWATKLGYNVMGALRIVAVHQDGTDDESAVLHGSGRLMVAPNSGGYMWESQPGFTDYELGGVDRGKVTANGTLLPGSPESVSFITPYLKNARLAAVVTNFDRQHDLHFTVGERCAQFLGPNGLEKVCAAGASFDVPRGETRRVPIEMLEAHFVDRQFVQVGVNEHGNHNWSAFLTAVDDETNDSIVIWDALSERLLTQR
ncbi:MAG: hypothetical protein DMF56_20095 [Acidobacteria bacterium]|nr:MAG: hypothetical protein DMF56_20095 [Acidobacteriota bacterium]